MVRVGDLIRIEFKGRVVEEDILRSEGVINFSVSENVCEIMVDDGESGWVPVVATMAQGGVQIKRVTTEQTDLEDVFIEFAKTTDSDVGLCI